MNGKHVFLHFCNHCGMPKEVTRDSMKKDMYLHCKNCYRIKNMPKYLRELADEI